MTRLLACVILIYSLNSQLSGSVGQDLLEKAGTIPAGRVLSFATNGNQTFLLFGNSVSLVANHQAGDNLSIRSTTTLQLDYDQVNLQGNWLYLFSKTGNLAVVRAYPDTLITVNESSIADSIDAVTAQNRYLYLADGFAGISILGVGDKSAPVRIGSASHGGYYSLVKICDSLLYAVDRLNGIDIYLIRGSTLQYQSTILADTAATDIACETGRLYACFGGDYWSSWFVDAQGRTSSPIQHHVDGEVLFVDVSTADLFVGLSKGRISLFDKESGISRGTFQMGFPLTGIAVSQTPEGTNYFALDHAGRLTVLFASGPGLEQTREFRQADLPSAIAATDRGLVIARSGEGIFRYCFDCGSAVETLLYPSSLSFSSLVFRDSILFAAVSNQPFVYVFKFVGGGLDYLGAVDNHIVARRLFVQSAPGGNFSIMSVGTESVEATALKLRGLVTDPLWNIKSPFGIVTSFCDETSLVLASEDGLVDYYCLDCHWPRPLFSGRDYFLQTPRAVVMIKGKYLVVGGGNGISLSYFRKESNDFQNLANLATVRSVTGLEYDPLRGVLLIAGGEEDLKYIDFTNPTALGPLYSVENSGGTITTTIQGDALYGLEPNGVSSYRFRPEITADPPSQPGLRVSNCFPNPFNSSTAIEIATTDHASPAARMKYQVINILGESVRDGELDVPGNYLQVFWDGKDSRGRSVGSGLYFFRLQTSGGEFVRKMLLIK